MNNKVRFQDKMRIEIQDMLIKKKRNPTGIIWFISKCA